MYRNAFRRVLGPASLLAAWCMLPFGSMPACARAVRPSAEALANTEDGGRLVALWQTLIDHSSDAVYNPATFQALASEVTACDEHLDALAKRGRLSEAVAGYLRGIYHMRYAYIRDCHYTTKSTIMASGAEASRTAALWVIELQLALLRHPPTCKEEKELAEAAVSNLAYQLSFIRLLDEFESEADRRRMRLRDREDAGEKVDLEAFERECRGKRALLVEAYTQRKLPQVSLVDEVLPILVAMTRARPSAYATAGGPARPDS